MATSSCWRSTRCRARAQGGCERWAPRLPCPGSGGSGSRPARRVRHRPRSGWKGPVAPGHRQCLLAPSGRLRTRARARTSMRRMAVGVNILLKQYPPVPCVAPPSPSCAGPRSIRTAFSPFCRALTGFFHPCWEAHHIFLVVSAPTPLDCASILSPLLCSPGNRVFSIGPDPVRWHRLSRGAPPQTPAPYP